MRLHHFTLQIGGISQRLQRPGGQTESVIFVDVPVDHEAVEVGMGHVTPECAQRRSARPGVEAVIRAQEGTIRVHRYGKPEAGGIRTGCHIVDIAVVRVGDPVRRCGVI